jgi:Mn2+/Fe2+ NRAMP family transporter
MSLSFIITAFLAKPDLLEMFKGLLIPSEGSAGILTVMALIGTTVVPYNLFLHSSVVSEKWKGKGYLNVARKELFWAIGLGGIVSMAIVVSAAASGITGVSSAADFAVGLEPLYGEYATWFIAVGLFSAGITSSITAPLAAAYVVKGCLGWKKGLTSGRFKLVWAAVLLLGMIFSSLGLKPVTIIQFAQVANGILLPVVAAFLFWVVNRRSLMGDYTNTWLQNLLGLFILLITLFLGGKSIFTVLEAL